MYHYELKHLLSLNLLKFSPFLKLILAFSSWLLILFYITLVVFDNSLTIWYVKLFQALNMYFLPQTWDQPSFLLKLLQSFCYWIVWIPPQFWLYLQQIPVGYGGGLPILWFVRWPWFSLLPSFNLHGSSKKRSCKKKVLSQSVYFLGSWG